jgi:hypothetical protein
MRGRPSEVCSEDIVLLKEYGAIRKKYEAVFGEYRPHIGQYPGADMIKEMSDKLDEYYRQQQEEEKRAPKLVTA